MQARGGLRSTEESTMSDDTNDTPRAIEVAPVTDDGPPSWHAPVTELKGRVTKLEAGQVAVNKKLDTIEAKTDAQTIMLGEIRGALTAAGKNPWVRAFMIALAVGLAGWLSRHGIKVEVPQ
jgi:hypothetical protein